MSPYRHILPRWTGVYIIPFPRCAASLLSSWKSVYLSIYPTVFDLSIFDRSIYLSIYVLIHPPIYLPVIYSSTYSASYLTIYAFSILIEHVFLFFLLPVSCCMCRSRQTLQYTRQVDTCLYSIPNSVRVRKPPKLLLVSGDMLSHHERRESWEKKGV